MKIFHIDRQRSWTGQINRVFNVAKGLSDQGYEVGIIGHPGSQLVCRCREAGLTVRTFPMRGWRLYPSILQIARYLRSVQVDILHCHGPRDHLLSVVAACLGSVKHVVRTKHNHNRLKSGYFSRLLYRKCSKVVTVSEYVRRRLIEDGMPPTCVETIYTGIDVNRFKPRLRARSVVTDLEIGEDELIIGCVSSLHVRKGIEEILKAFKILQRSMAGTKLKCLLVGKNWQRWEAMALKLRIKENVILTGFRRNVADFLSMLDVYVLPSRDEALGTSILEAMAMGLPVIASNVGGIPEALRDQAGVIVSSRDPEGLAKAIKKVLEDRHLRKRLGKNARERAKAEFSIETLVTRTAELYEQLMREK